MISAHIPKAGFLESAAVKVDEHIVPYCSILRLNSNVIVNKMKLRIQTLTGETQEVEAEPQNSILDLKVMMVNTIVNMRESRSSLLK